VPHSEVYTFGGVTLDVAERRLSSADGALALAPKAFELLVALVRRAGRLVSKQELLEIVWPEAFVEEGILSVHVSALRKALGDSGRSPRCIETVARAGYRFIAPVVEERQPVPGIPLSRAFADPAQRTRVDVFELCGRGRAHLLSAAMREVPHAVDAFRAAAALDPTYAPAQAGVALACCAQASMRLAPPLDAYREARAAALRALSIDDRSADAQLALGTVLFFAEWDWPAAERCLRRAIDINSASVEAYLILGRLLDALGRPQDALEMKMRAFERDPLSPLVHVQIAQCFWNQRRYDDAIEWATRAVAIDPRHALAREFLAAAYLFKGDFARYIAEMVSHAAAHGVPSCDLSPIETAHSEGGPAAVWALCLEQMADNPQVPALQLAAFSAQAGRIDEAFDHLDRAILAHDPSLVDLAVAPQWDGLRRDPRFAQLIARMGLVAAPRPVSQP
jgi:DNA-binding winged helix-turn-helix (wHTH) protein